MDVPYNKAAPLLAQAQSINDFFANVFQKIACDENVKSYIVSIFSKYKTSYYDLSKDSITIQFSIAKQNNNFEKFQTIGDWLFWMSSICPEYLQSASKDYYYSVGRNSYFNCYRIVRQFEIYEILADDFVPLSEQSAEILSELKQEDLFEDISFYHIFNRSK
jgi:hypothetical protein